MADKKGKRPFLWIIVGLIFVGLLGFGGTGLTGNVRTIGSVGDKDITVASYQQALQQQLRALQAQFGSPVSFQQALQLGVDQTAQSQLILGRALDHEATELGVSIGDERVRDEILNEPSFRGGSGNFNRESYRAALQQAGLNENEYENGIREDSSRALLQGAVVGGVPTVDIFADTVVKYMGEQRSITWATVTADMLTGPVPGATEADVQAYYDANPDNFTTSETREITFAWITPSMIRDTVEVSDSDVEALYNERIEEFVIPERRLVERLAYVDEAKAQEAKARLDSGDATFEQLVEERGLSLSDVDLGDVDRDTLGEAGDTVFNAQPGDVLGPFPNTIGSAIYRMNAVLAAQETPLEEAAQQLRDELANTLAARQINQNAEQYIDLLAGGATLETLVEQTGLELGTISWEEGSTDDIAAYERFRAAAAGVSEGDFPELVELADGGVFALRLDGITPPTLQPLDDVRDEVGRQWQEQARQDAIIARAEEIAADITAETDFTTLELEPLVEANLDRRSFVEGTPPDFNETMFDMVVGEARVLDTVDRAIILRVDSIAPPDPEGEQTVAQIQSLSESTSAGIAQDIFAAYADILVQNADVNINQATVNAVHAQLQ